MKKYVSFAVTLLILCGLFGVPVGQAQTTGAQPVSVPGVAQGYTIIPGGTINSSDQIVQLNNLTLQNTPGTGSSGMLYASYSSGMTCTQFYSAQSSAGQPIACPVIAQNVLYQISVDPATVLLLSNRGRASLSDFSVGDRLNVYGFIDSGTNYMQALIVRDLDKPAFQSQQYFTQFNNVIAVTAPGAPVPQVPGGITASFDITFAPVPCALYSGPAGYRLPTICPYVPMTTAGVPNGFMLTKHTVNVLTGQTVILNKYRQTASLGMIQAGDVLNVFGRYNPQIGSIDALIIRDLSSNGLIYNGPPLNISGISGPTSLQPGQQGTWTVQTAGPIPGNLSYSVVWGDEVYFTNGAGIAASPNGVSQSATFTHVYTTAGVYRPVFTVAGGNGATAQSSLSVNVGSSFGSGSVGVTVVNRTIQCFSAPCGLTPNAAVTITGNGVSFAGVTDNNGHVIFSNLSAGTYTVQVTNMIGSGAQIVSVQAGETDITIYVTGSTQTGTPQITAITPQTVAPGATVTLTGNGFLSQGNTISMVRSDGNYPLTITNASLSSSFQTTSLTFQVPQYWGPQCSTGLACPQYLMLLPGGTYNVSVQNQNGTSNATTLFVSSNIIAPNTLTVTAPNGGEQLVRNSQYAIRWSVPATPLGQVSAGNSFDIFLSHRSVNGDAVANVQYIIAKNVFADFGLAGGTYQWTVGVNQDNSLAPDGGNYYIRVCYAGTSTCDESDNAFTLVPNGSQNGNVQVFGLQPAQGSPNTTITLTGSGFLAQGNIVHFEMDGTNTAYLPNLNANGNALTFQVPSFSSYACSYSTYPCSLPSRQLSSGTYRVWVENSSGSSNAVNFSLLLMFF
jgi:hypothetical protein